MAVSDPLQLIATPLRTVAKEHILTFLKTYLHEESVEAIVVGLPLHANGKYSHMAHLVQQFVRILKRYFPTKTIFTHDERFTSALAQKSLLEANFPRKKRQSKAILDAVSATLILHTFLPLYKRRSINSSVDLNKPIAL